MPPKIADLTQIVMLAREGATLTDLQACTGKLWLAEDGNDDDALRKAVDAHRNRSTSDDPYWDFLAGRGNCSRCGETNKYENLSVCPNCFKTFCYRESRACGYVALG